MVVCDVAGCQDEMFAGFWGSVRGYEEEGEDHGGDG